VQPFSKRQKLKRAIDSGPGAASVDQKGARTPDGENQLIKRTEEAMERAKYTGRPIAMGATSLEKKNPGLRSLGMKGSSTEEAGRAMAVLGEHRGCRGKIQRPGPTENRKSPGEMSVTGSK